MRALLGRAAYAAALWLALPCIPVKLLRRGLRERGYLRHVPERFGFYGPPPGPCIWLHAVSVGETRAAAPLVEALRRERPELRILLTHMTAAGRDAGRSLFGDQVSQCWLPYDYPFAVRRFLRHFRPRLGLLLETEVWFNLVRGCRREGVPLLLVNARLSEKSARGYARLGALAAEAFGGLAAVGAQTEADAQRLWAVGAREVRVTGNVKFDIAPPDAALEAGAALRALFGRDRPVVLAASTRDGEEAPLVKAFADLDLPGLLIVVVPRHPQRFDEVAGIVRRLGLPLQRRSEGRPVAPETRVVLGDSMGEMFAYYAAADLAFIGGSLLPYGAQNLIEACAVGTPVLIGPSTFNFAEATRLALAAGAALQVADAAEAAAAAAKLLGDAARRRSMGEAGKRFAAENRGATERTLALLRPWLEGKAATGRAAG